MGQFSFRKRQWIQACGWSRETRRHLLPAGTGVSPAGSQPPDGISRRPGRVVRDFARSARALARSTGSVSRRRGLGVWAGTVGWLPAGPPSRADRRPCHRVGQFPGTRPRDTGPARISDPPHRAALGQTLPERLGCPSWPATVSTPTPLSQARTPLLQHYDTALAASGISYAARATTGKSTLTIPPTS